MSKVNLESYKILRAKWEEDVLDRYKDRSLYQLVFRTRHEEPSEVLTAIQDRIAVGTRRAIIMDMLDEAESKGYEVADRETAIETVCFFYVARLRVKIFNSLPNLVIDARIDYEKKQILRYLTKNRRWEQFVDKSLNKNI